MDMCCKLYGLLLMVFHLQGVTTFFWTVSYSYVGCFLDDTPRALEYQASMEHTTVSQCVRLCRMLGFTFAGLQYSSVCFCGNEYDTYGAAQESQCNMKCDGNRNQICGGSWVNSVYSVCSPGYYGIWCFRRCIPYTCQPNICRFNNGGCLYESCDRKHSYCKKDCYTLIASKMVGVNILYLRTSVSLFLFSKASFSQSGTISEIEFLGKRAGTVYVSFWREVDKYTEHNKIMVGKIQIQSTKEGIQTVQIPRSTTVYVQAGDVPGIHYTAGSDDVIYYEESTSVSDLRRTDHKNVQAKYFKSSQRITFAYSNDRRTTVLKISLDCITYCPAHCKWSQCNRESGRCDSCEDGYYGVKCEHECPKHCECNRYTGDCEKCKNGYYGPKCENECPAICEKRFCNSTNGQCGDCLPGYHGETCQECSTGYYGINCEGVCSDHCQFPPCIATSLTGECPEKACEDGYYEDNCQGFLAATTTKKSSMSTHVIVISSLVPALFVIAMVIVFIVFMTRKMKSRKKSPETKTAETKKSTLSLEYLEIPNDTPSRPENIYESVI